MPSEPSNINRLEGLSAEVLAADPSDQETIVRIGTGFEELLQTLSTAPDWVTDLLAGTLGALQAVHAGSVADPAPAMEAVAEAAAAVAQWLGGDDQGAGAKSAQDITQALRGVTDPGSQAPSAETETGEAAACPDPAPSVPVAADPPPSNDADEPPAVLPEDTDPDILREFVIECLDHISGAEAALLDLESNPEEPEQRRSHRVEGRLNL